MKLLDALIDLFLSILAACLAILALPLGMGAAALMMLAMISNSMTSRANENS